MLASLVLGCGMPFLQEEIALLGHLCFAYLWNDLSNKGNPWLCIESEFTLDYTRPCSSCFPRAYSNLVVVPHSAASILSLVILTVVVFESCYKAGAHSHQSHHFLVTSHCLVLLWPFVGYPSSLARVSLWGSQLWWVFLSLLTMAMYAVSSLYIELSKMSLSWLFVVVLRQGFLQEDTSSLCTQGW